MKKPLFSFVQTLACLMLLASFPTLSQAQYYGTEEEAIKVFLSEKQPSCQFTNAEDLGALCAFLCSDSAKNIIGASYMMDGGWTAQ